jgi:hypothetical protein
MVQFFTPSASAKCREDRERVERTIVRYGFLIQRENCSCGEQVVAPRATARIARLRYAMPRCNSGSNRVATRENRALDAPRNVRIFFKTRIGMRPSPFLSYQYASPGRLPWTIFWSREWFGSSDQAPRLWHVPMSRAESSARKARAPDAHSQ